MKYLSVKSKLNIDAQDGGFTTTLLSYCLENGILDAVVVVGDKNWKPVAYLATTPTELLKSTKSKYSISPNNKLLEYATENYDKVGLVGLPCHILGGLQFNLTLKVGLFCTKNFYYETIKNIIKERLGLNMDEVSKMNITKGKFVVETLKKKGFAGTEKVVYEIPIKEIEKLCNLGCRVCTDFSAKYADVSVGSVGSEDGWNTVIIRNKMVEDIINEMVEKGLIEVKETVDIKAVEKLENIKKKNEEINKCSAYFAVCPALF
ncbi:coenzyme F420 hydrogenase/dehydrogenase beta subunit domain protein [Methanocaldococcus sp. FS406-22]|uniref:Coenzyme F420 hydrogenase/dehydrogenase, beta subunit C-terminal domain n=1 Tax=Methanocaldococcus sp. (strain FS406-22) TaxID=644281 RepID=UPI0001C4E1A3|nr:Coenzyme F420 hydrogenase/dehydrogenase, beta subunit C-terminal domain [Methanocaldococcus sp. FS406-22]ADC70121.1 coenzyme F420 hydrogenase/dehydrogenase beta subunit domain protein [Methanocaldococcus sp. FS406-22]